MSWDLPLSVNIDGVEYAIRNKCDYRVVLDTIKALNDEDLELVHRIDCALFIFYEDLNGCKNIQKAVDEMMKIINLGKEEQDNNDNKPQLIDWEHDFPNIVPPVSRVLGYSVRDVDRYTHWYDFIGAYHEIGNECSWAVTISIRSKRMKGKKLETWEQEYLNENYDMVMLPLKLTEEDREFLFDDE